MVMTGSSIVPVASRLAPYGVRWVGLAGGFEVPSPWSIIEYIKVLNISRSHLQKATQEGDVVGPFLEGVVEQ